MADDVTLPATGVVIAADEIAGKKYQRVKISHGPDGEAVDASEDAPFPVDAVGGATETTLVALAAALTALTAVVSRETTLAALLTNAEDGDPVPVVGISAKVPVTPTVTSGAYTANDVIGGKLTFADMARVSGGSGWLQSVTIGLKAAITPNLELWLFDADPTNTSLADNAAWSLNAADLGKVFAIVKFAAADWCDGGTPNVASIEYVRKYSLTATSMFGYLVDRTGVTLTSTSDVVVTPKAALD